MKKLSELNPQFIGMLRPDSGEGLKFDCPKCTEKPHQCVVYFRNPIDGLEIASWHKEHQLWERVNDNFETLTVSPSVQYACFHGWVELGKVFDITEGPAVVPQDRDGQNVLVVLSPMQTIAYANEISMRAYQLLGAV